MSKNRRLARGSERIQDPQALKALAHPARIRLLAELRTFGPLRVTDLVERCGLSPASTSYHLRQLAAHDFIREVPTLARDKREHWWEAAGSLTWSTADFLDRGDQLRVEVTLQEELLQLQIGRYRDYLASLPQLDPAWADAAANFEHTVRLSPKGLRKLYDQLQQLLEGIESLPEPEHDDPLVRMVAVHFQAFPLALEHQSSKETES
jgi:DNA-binding transcriptional ArsR family regulator